MKTDPLHPYPGKLQCTTTSLEIDPRLEKLVPQLTAEEDARLEEDIAKNGIKVPLVVDEVQQVIYDGMNRYKKAVKLDIPFVPIYEITFENFEQAKEYVISNLLSRRHLSTWHKAKLGLELMKVEKVLAKQRQKAGTLAHENAKGKASEKVSEKAGVGSRTLEMAQKILECADQDTINKLDSGAAKPKTVYNQIIIRENKKLPKMKIPAGQYNLIIWDPSWPHDIEVAGGSGTSGNAQKYRPESIDELKKKGLQKVLAKDAILGIWTLPTFHSEVLDVIRANGFEKIKTKIYWDKMIPSMGFNFRNYVEELCICVRGNVKAFWQNDQPNIIHVQRGGPHSRKPDIFFEIMEKAAKAGLPKHKLSKLEINSTKPRKGWVTVGNQLNCLDCNQFHIDHNTGPEDCSCKCHPRNSKKQSKENLQEKCKCNHTKILHNTDHTTGKDNEGSCVYQSTCGCKHFTAKKSGRKIVA